MALIRSRLPRWFKLSTTPLFLWLLVVISYVWPADPKAMWLIRSAAFPYAVLATVYIVVTLAILKLRKVSLA